MNFPRVVVLAAAVAALTACASRQQGAAPAPSPAPAPAAAAPSPAPAAKAGSTAAAPGDMRMVKSRDGTFEGEMVGTPAKNSRFAKLAIGMEYEEVTKLIGAPNSMHMHETGKRWIPFYYGNDVTRMETIYTGEGCLAFTGGNHWGGGGHQLIRITADPSGAKCTN